MKSLSIILCLLAAAFADNGRLPSADMEEATPYEGRADITLNLINTFTPSGQVFGLFADDPAGADAWLLTMNKTAMRIDIYDAAGGSMTGSINLDTENTSGFGVALHTANSQFYTNDWLKTDLFYTDNWGSTWNTIFDPTDTAGRGLDYDGAFFWTTNGTGSIVRFYPGYGTFTTLSVPETSGQLTGITAFPYQSYICVALTSYSAQSIWFYLYDGYTLSYLGAAITPVSSQSSYGLAYSTNLESIFWAYEPTGGGYRISQMEFEVSQALNQSTWGGIKRAF